MSNYCKNCYELTKKLEAKEQECEALQMSENEAGEIIADLKAECERLKYDNGYEVGALEKTIYNLKAELEQEKALKETYLACYKAKHEDIRSKLFRYKQALTEIKEIAEKDKLACESCSERYTDVCTGYKDFENEGDCTHCGIGARAKLAEQILQLISEVEND